MMKMMMMIWNNNNNNNNNKINKSIKDCALEEEKNQTWIINE